MGLASGSAALHLALRIADVGPAMKFGFRP